MSMSGTITTSTTSATSTTIATIAAMLATAMLASFAGSASLLVHRAPRCHVHTILENRCSLS